MENTDNPNVLGAHLKHLFIFTSAGKPIFSRYEGDSADLTALYGLLLVLVRSSSMTSALPSGADGKNARGQRLRRLETSVPTRSLPGAPASASAFARVTFYVEQQGDVLYVLAARSPTRATRLAPQQEPVVAARDAVAPPPPRSAPRFLEREEREGSADGWDGDSLASDGNHAEAYEGDPALAPEAPREIVDSEAVCRAQLRFAHALLLSVAPTLPSVLAKDPSYDVRTLFSPADFDLLRAGLTECERSVALASGAVEVLPLWGRTPAGMPAPLIESGTPLAGTLQRLAQLGIDTAGVFHFVELLLQRHSRTAPSPGTASSSSPPPTENVIFAGLATLGRAAVSLPLLLACVDRSQQLFQTPILPSDVSLLLMFAQDVLRRQLGEAWAPVTLPGFSTSGYVWCYCCLLGGVEVARGGELMLVQVSVSEQDFSVLSNAASAICSDLLSVTLKEFPLEYDPVVLSRTGEAERQLAETKTVLFALTEPPPEPAALLMKGNRTNGTVKRRKTQPHTGNWMLLGDTPQRQQNAVDPAFLAFFSQRRARHERRRAVLRYNTTNAVGAMLGFSAVYMPRSSGTYAGRTNGNERGGLRCTAPYRRCVTAVRCRPPVGPLVHHDFNALLAAARRQAHVTQRTGDPRLQSPFTLLQLDGESGEQSYRIVLLGQPQSAHLLTQLCQSFYRSPDALTEAEKKAIAATPLPAQDGGVGAEPAAPRRPIMAAPRPYQFSQLLQAVTQSGLGELCVVMDANASLEASWYCVMMVLHTLVLE